MFPTLFEFLSNLFSRLNPPLQQSVESLLDRQVQSEIARSIEEGMVVTRSQEHAQSSGELQSPLEHQSFTVQIRKRNAQQDSNPSRAPEVSKRRRMIAVNVPSTDLPNKNHRVPNDLPYIDEGEVEDGNDSLDMEPLGAAIEGNEVAVIGQTTSIEETMEGKSLEHRADLGYDLNRPDFAEDADSATIIGQTKKIEYTKEAELLGHGVNHSISNTTQERVLRVSNHAGSVDAAVKLPKPTHKRFGSEDTGIDQSQSKLDIVTTLNEDPRSNIVLGGSNSDESEDEEPETVTAAAAVGQSRAVAAEAQRVVERQHAAAKKKRKERDHLLKTQAKSGTKKKKKEKIPQAQSPSQDTISESVTMTSNEPPKQEKWLMGTSLPALLPKDLLEEEPVVHPPTPPTNISSNKMSAKTKLKLQRKQSEFPKVIKRGMLSIRVLETDQSLLPPKASKNSKVIRESWLAGHRGTSFVPRKKLGGGFVRK